MVGFQRWERGSGFVGRVEVALSFAYMVFLLSLFAYRERVVEEVWVSVLL